MSLISDRNLDFSFKLIVWLASVHQALFIINLNDSFFKRCFRGIFRRILMTCLLTNPFQLLVGDKR